MRRLALLLPLVLVTSCTFFDWESTRRNPRYCQSDNDCKDSSLPFCDTQSQECEAAPVCQPICGDGGADMHADQDMGMCTAVCGDMAGADLTSGPDLSCTDSASCGDTTPICDGTCRACASSTDDTQCGLHNAATPLCGSSGKCVACRIAMDCTVTTLPLCDTNGSCRACTTGDDSACSARSSGALPKCDVPSGKCVQCVSNGDCSSTSTAPICGSNRTCRACSSNSECPALAAGSGWPTVGFCKMDGSCAVTGDVAFVDNTVTCSASANPFCEVAQAVSSSGKAIIVVRGSSTIYQQAVSISSTSGTLSILGPGPSASPTAQITQNTLAALTVATSGVATATVVADGLDLIGSAGGTKKDGVVCSQLGGATSLTIRNSLIHDSGSAGVNSTSCALTLTGNTIGANSSGGGGNGNGSAAGVSVNGGTVIIDANIINGNGRGGIKVTGAIYTITNNIVAGNGSATDALSGPGVSMDATSTSLAFAFNTVVKNRIQVGAGGIDCGAGATKPILDSIVWDNDTTTASQLGTQCTTTNVVTGTGTAAGSPVFTTDFHLQANTAGNTSCCVDKVANPGTPNADHDVDRASRPKGATGKWTIGGNELAQ